MIMKGARARWVMRVVALVVVTALLVTAARRLSFSRVLAELVVVQPLWMALALLCFVSILPLWALQWRLLATSTRTPRLRTMLGVVAMTSTVLNTAPMLVGEAAGVYFLIVEAGLARGAALSVLAMDQLFVGVAKVFVLATAATLVVLPMWMARGAQALVVAVALLSASLVVVAWRAEPLSKRASRWIPARLARLILTVGRALEPVRSPTRSTGALALALAKKLAEVLAILCVQRAFGVELSLGSAVLVLAATNLATLLPIVPGNIGVYEAAVVLAYSSFGISAERALGIAVVQHACFFVALALPGYRWLARSAATRAPEAAV
ncbi:MAG TPA: lysylphosphatidylglycerol synthase transmembrane domain-containing protein [Gemmatimonadaceae bacterium]|nr:lysylphosphatidylglycerol synthase transmembrane domain-containing protein [Gemmatimonadaceae bacterium]